MPADSPRCVYKWLNLGLDTVAELKMIVDVSSTPPVYFSKYTLP